MTRIRSWPRRSRIFEAGENARGPYTVRYQCTSKEHRMVNTSGALRYCVPHDHIVVSARTTRAIIICDSRSLSRKFTFIESMKLKPSRMKYYHTRFFSFKWRGDFVSWSNDLPTPVLPSRVFLHAHLCRVVPIHAPNASFLPLVSLRQRAV